MAREQAEQLAGRSEGDGVPWILQGHPGVSINDIPGYGITLGSPVDGLLMGLAIWGTEKIDAVVRCVYNTAEAFASGSGKNVDVMAFMELVGDYMKRTSWLSGGRLHCYFLRCCGQKYVTLRRPEDALRVYLYAQEISTGKSEMADIETYVCFGLGQIYINSGQVRESQIAYQRVLDLSESTVWSGAREHIHILHLIGCACESLGRFEEGIEALTYALKISGEMEGQSRQQIELLLAIATTYVLSDFQLSHHASLLLLEQALLGVTSQECTCSVDQVDDFSNWGGTGMLRCAHHQLQATILDTIGRVQETKGYIIESEESYKRGLALAQECDDKILIAGFHYVLANLYATIAANSASNLSGQFLLLRTDASKRTYYHNQQFLDSLTPGLSWSMQQGAAFNRHFPPGVLGLQEIRADEKVVALYELLRLSEEKGNFESHAVIHTQLSFIHYSNNSMEACREELLLALQFFDKMPTSKDVSYFTQTLGQIALLLGELDVTEDIWKRVTSLSEEVLQSLGGLDVKDALHFLEMNKHAYMCMANCCVLRLENSTDQELRASYIEKALVWAERSKGRVLMSCLAAAERSTKAKREVQDRDSGSPRYPVDFESCFYNNDGFARKVIFNGSENTVPLSSKIVFVEYTFSDYTHMLIHLVRSDISDGSTGWSPETQPQMVRCSLHNLIDQSTQKEAEEELEALMENSRIEYEANRNLNMAPMATSREMECPRSETLEAAAVHKLLSAINPYGTRMEYYNPWIPGLVAKIQRLAVEAQERRKRHQIIDDEEKAMRTVLEKLYRVLIGPVKDELDTLLNPEDTLVFVPHEDLGLVPFAALRDPASGKCLIEQHAICISPSIWCTRHCQKLYNQQRDFKDKPWPFLMSWHSYGCTEKRSEARDACPKDRQVVQTGIDCYFRLHDTVRTSDSEGPELFVGRKSGYPLKWPDLTEAHNEVKEVLKSCGQTAVPVLDDNPDTKLHMKEKVMELLPKASWIHFAVHGQISNQFPTGSLLLGGDDSQRLTADEIAAQPPWRSRSAILSACQTGLGSVGGEGILGFARSFILAGVPSCILAMWEANQSFCLKFMANLYSQLSLGDDLAHAMQKTMVSMMWEQKPKKKNLSTFEKFALQNGIEIPQEAEAGTLLKWSVYDWAVFSCFGFPGVKFPKRELQS